MTAVWHCDHLAERENHMDELDHNPDFTYIGHYDSLQDIYEDLNDEGFSDAAIQEMAQNRYGRCLEIIEYASHYDAYIGNR